MEKRKVTYEQALGLERGQAKARHNRKVVAAQATTLTPEANKAWNAAKREALAKRRAAKRAAEESFVRDPEAWQAVAAEGRKYR